MLYIHTAKTTLHSLGYGVFQFSSPDLLSISKQRRLQTK